MVDAIVTCQLNNTGLVRWFAPPGTLIGAVSQANPTRIVNDYMLMYIGDGVSTLTFNAATDKNGTVIQCQDLTDGGSDTCSIYIAG